MARIKSIGELDSQYSSVKVLDSCDACEFGHGDILPEGLDRVQGGWLLSAQSSSSSSWWRVRHCHPPHDDGVDVEHRAFKAHRIGRVGHNQFVSERGEGVGLVVEAGVAGLVK